MITLIECRNYTVVRVLPDDTQYEILPSLCSALESQTGGFAVIARKDGKTIADATGMSEDNSLSLYERQCGAFNLIE